MQKQPVIFSDLGVMDYGAAWSYQEKLLQQNVRVKSEARSLKTAFASGSEEIANPVLQTQNHLLFVEHPAVYTLGKSGHEENILISEENMRQNGIEYFKTNRGGDITFHGPGQIVAYPIFDLEYFGTD